MGGTYNPLAMGQAFGDLLNKILGADVSKPQDVEKFKKLSDAEKIAVMDQVAEMIGGTAGSFAGSGLASIPAAGAGAVIGRNLVSRPLAKAFGLKETPRTAGEEVIDTAKVFGLNAAGEGIGRAVPAVFKVGKTAIKNAVKKSVKPTAAADALKVLADQYGITLNLGQRSGKPLVQSIETALDRFPVTTEAIRNARKAQYGQYQSAINGWLDQLHNGKINTEEFARLAGDTMKQLQTKFNTRVAEGAGKAAVQLAPGPVSNLEAGQALRTGLESNADTVSKWANKAYGDIRAKHGSAPIDVTKLGESASELLGEIPEGQLQNIFPPRAMRLLNAANVKPTAEVVTQSIPSIYDDIAKAQSGVMYSHLNEAQKASVRKMAEMGGEVFQLPSPVVTPASSPTITMAEAMQTRSELLRRASKTTDKNEQRYLYTLADSINDSMESSLANVPGAEKAYQKLQGLNSQYRGFMEQLRPPQGKGRAGSVAAATIIDHPIPEQLPPLLSSTETLIDQTRSAVSPKTTKGIGGAGPEPMQDLRRNRFDSMINRATVTDPTTGFNRISPTRFAESLPPPPAREGLYGQQLPDVSGIGKPKLVAREQLLFNSPLPRALAAEGNAMNTYNAAFPRHGFGDQVGDTISLFNEVGRAPQAKRGFAEGLIEQSQRRNPTISDEEILSPRVLETTTRKYGETAPRVLGSDMQGLTDITELGKGITQAEQRLGNPSGTARVTENLSFGKRLLTPKELPYALKDAALAMYGANRFSNPKSYEWMFEKPEKLMQGFGSPVSGTLGRMALPSRPEPAPKDDQFGPIVNDDQFGPVVEDPDDEFGPIVK